MVWDEIQKKDKPLQGRGRGSSLELMVMLSHGMLDAKPGAGEGLRQAIVIEEI